MKIGRQDMTRLAERMADEDTIDCLVRTRRQPNDCEREILSQSGCTFLSGSAGTVSWVRLRSLDVNVVANLGFVEGIEVLSRA